MRIVCLCHPRGVVKQKVVPLTRGCMADPNPPHVPEPTPLLPFPLAPSLFIPPSPYNITPHFSSFFFSLYFSCFVPFH